jgi:hypothetical protein
MRYKGAWKGYQETDCIKALMGYDSVPVTRYIDVLVPAPMSCTIRVVIRERQGTFRSTSLDVE